MPAWLFFPLLRSANWAIETYRKILDVTMTFADLCSQISFSLFISFSSDDDELIENYINAYYYLLLAYTYFCTPELLIIKYYDSIEKNPQLRDWFSHTKYLKSLMTAVERAREEHAEVNDLRELLEAIYEYSPLSFILSIKENIIDNTIELLNEIANHFQSFTHYNAHEMYARIKRLIQLYDQAEVKEIKITRSDELIAKLNPFLPFCFTNLTAHIQAFYSYVNAYERKIHPPLPTQLLRSLRADLYFDEKKVAETHADENLEITFRVDKQTFFNINPKLIKIDFAGITQILKRIREIEELFPLKIKETWDDVGLIYPLKITERWEESKEIIYNEKIIESWES